MPRLIAHIMLPVNVMKVMNPVAAAVLVAIFLSLKPVAGLAQIRGGSSAPRNAQQPEPLRNILSKASQPLVQRKTILITAQKLILENQGIQEKRRAFGFSLKHPSFQLHTKIRSVRFEQTYLESTKEILRKEWRVVGGDVQAHFFPETGQWKISDHLYNFKREFRSEDLVQDRDILAQMPRDLHLSASLDSRNFVLRHRLWPTSDVTFIPVLWIETKAQGGSPGYTLVYNLDSGNLIFKYQKNIRVSATPPPIKIFDGRWHILKTNKPEEKINTASLPIANVCQLISENKDTKGEPILIHIEKCESGRDDSAKRAQSNSELILEYFLSQHAQYGYDNDETKKTAIRSLVHAGERFENAYWDSENEIMVYGDGSGGVDKDATNDFTLALDIAGHEFTHAIVSSTANFVTPSDPGALNEGFADIFGVLISRYKIKNANWNIGAALYKNNAANSDDNEELALRSLSRPSKFSTSSFQNGKYVMLPFPENYSQRLAKDQECNDDNDQCEVHANSTIWSHAAYLIDQGLQKKLDLDSQVADKKVADLYFLTMTHKLHENETMPTAAKALLETCHELMTQAECGLVKDALIQVQLVAP